MSVEAPGDTGKKEPLRDPAECDPAALFDAIIGQQDRHDTNYRWQPGGLGLWSWLNRILRLDQVEALRDGVERMLASGRLLDPLEF